jgi:type II secretory pathway component GspD/PulD (secretin)
MIKPITSLAILAFAFSAFAQSQTVKIKSKGDDVRTVIETIFEQTGKQYVLESNLHQSLYMSLDGVPFLTAIEIISNVTDMEFAEKQGIWFIHKKPVTSGHTFAPTPSATKDVSTTKPTVIASPLKSNAPAKTVSKKVTIPKRPAPKLTTPNVVTTSKVLTPVSVDTPIILATKAIPVTTVTTGTTVTKTPKSKVDLTGRLTVQLKRMDIQEVFAEFGRQAKVDIEIDGTVPNYKLDASFYNTTLKFALDKVCKVAGLKYTMTPSNKVRVSKA